MASKASLDFVKVVATSLNTAVAAGVGGGSYLQDKGKTETIKQTGTAIEFVANQLDVAIGLVEEYSKAGKGKPPTQALASLLAIKLLSFGDFAPQESIQCGTALVSLGLGLGPKVAAIGTGVGALPAGVLLLTDLYATYVDCKGPATKAVKEGTSLIDKGKNAIGVFAAKLDAEIYKLYGVPK
jgi:hypothetical protein